MVERLPLLRELFISRNPIRNIPDFSKCAKLTTLVMNENTFADLECLGGSAVEQMGIRRLKSRLTSLCELGLFDYHRENLDFLSSMQKVATLHLQSSYELDLSPLEKKHK